MAINRSMIYQRSLPQRRNRHSRQLPLQGKPSKYISNVGIYCVLSGNIRVCQGYRGSLRAIDGNLPGPPHDIVIGRLERRPFRDPSGSIKTPTKASAAHYRLKLMCLRAADPSFVPSSIVVPSEVALVLNASHHQLLLFEFGYG